MASRRLLRSLRNRLCFVLICLALLLGSDYVPRTGGGPRVWAATDATITVTTVLDTVTDDGLCSLREAIIAANTNSAYNGCPAGGATDTIDFDPGLGTPAVFQLTRIGAGEDASQTGDLDIQGTVTINGAGLGSTFLDGTSSDRVLDIRPAARVTISGVTIQHGNPGAAEGGGVYIRSTGRLTLNASQVTSNTAMVGGAVMSLGMLTANDSTISSNTGGGIKNDAGLLYLSNVQVSDNPGGPGIINLNSAYMDYDVGTLSGNGSDGIQNTLGSEAILAHLSIQNHTTGRGILNSGATNTRLTLSNSTISQNTATSGAGILNSGNGAVATITNSTIQYNTASGAGGGIDNSGSLVITLSTLDHNQARSGGGIDHIGASLSLTNVTISQNSASDNGGGIYNRNTTTLNFVTLVGNSAGAPGTGGNLYMDGEGTSISIHNTIIANGGTAGNCGNNLGQINSLGYNLEDTNTCELNNTGDQVNTPPNLGPLQNNGGLTHTHALVAMSTAVDGGHSTGCSGITDQRGVSRPQGATCDIGAYELILGGAANLSLTKVDAVDPVTVGGNIVYNLMVNNTGPDSAVNTILTDNLPAGVSFVSATPSTGNCGHASQVVTCNLGTIASAGSATVQIVATANTTGVKVNNASVSSNTADPNPANNSASASTTVNPVDVPQANLSLTKVDAVDPVLVGRDITYTLTVGNAGPDTAQAVTLTDNLPTSLVYVSATPGQGSCAHLSGVVTCNLGNIPSAAQVSVQVVAITTQLGLQTNNASVTSSTADPNTANNSASVNTTVITEIFLPLILSGTSN